MAQAADRPRVLVIDDERGLRELLEYGLEQAGFAVRSVDRRLGRAARSCRPGRPT